MSLFIATDIHIHKKDNHYYLASQVYYIAKRYYDQFGKIAFYLRLSEKNIEEELFDVTDMVQEVIIIDRLSDTLKKTSDTRIMQAMKSCDLVVGRFHSLSGCQAARCAKKMNKPFLAEVMGDAFDGYWNHGITGKIVAPIIFLMTQSAIKDADYGLYVTEHFLQDKYPCKGECINASNVKILIPDRKILQERLLKIEKSNLKDIKIMTSAGIDVEAKGQQYVIKAIPELNRRGYRVTYYLAGGGNKEKLENISKELGITNQVIFLGRLTHDEVLAKLQEIDWYVQPSLQEGLPRSVIEAMSYACPVLGARTAGIPELINKSCVFKRKSSKNFIKIFIKNMNKANMKVLSCDNYRKSIQYNETELDIKRKQFFDRIKNNIT